MYAPLLITRCFPWAIGPQSSGGLALLQHSMLCNIACCITQHITQVIHSLYLLANAACMLDTTRPWLMQGQGVVQPDKLKRAADPVRQAANMVSSMLGGSNSSEYNSHMLRSNRQEFSNFASQSPAFATVLHCAGLSQAKVGVCGMLFGPVACCIDLDLVPQ